MLILYNVRMDMAGGVDFSAANAKSNAQLRVKGPRTFLFIHSFKLKNCLFRLNVVHTQQSFSFLRRSDLCTLSHYM